VELLHFIENANQAELSSVCCVSRLTLLGDNGDVKTDKHSQKMRDSFIGPIGVWVTQNNSVRNTSGLHHGAKDERRKKLEHTRNREVESGLGLKRLLQFLHCSQKRGGCASTFVVFQEEVNCFRGEDEWNTWGPFSRAAFALHFLCAQKNAHKNKHNTPILLLSLCTETVFFCISTPFIFLYKTHIYLYTHND